ncbi:radical SAM family heme chaperone HemW [Chloroflexota bacterium]
MTDKTALYIHIPFCRRRCTYCSFTSYEGRETDIAAYVDALIRELALYPSGLSVGSVYFGGGTPSLISVDQFDELLSFIRSRFKVDERAEMTIEANPGTVDDLYLSSIRSLGINRLSLGIQSLDDGELRILGRIHTSAEALRSVSLARDAGFENINGDIMYGIPSRSKGEWIHMLEDVIDLQLQHLSLYPLTLEGDELLCAAIQRGEMEPLDADATADQYELAEYLLGSHGYRHYEISNWACWGHECKHNMTYWLMRPYIGIGVSAHSYVDGRRRANTSDLDGYLDSFSSNIRTTCEVEECIGPDIELSEAVILGLRLTSGVDTAAIRSRYKVDLIERYGDQVAELAGLGLIEHSGGSIRLTGRGRLLGNQVFLRFMPD